jgi:RNA polymerase sigma-70 factor (ECF subfamily)
MDETPQQAEWQQWLQEYAPKLLLFARQQSRSEADAQDLVQEALVEAAQRLHDDRPPPPPLVFATIRRRAVDLARREGRRIDRELASSESAVELWFDTTVEQRERAKVIQDAMCRLPEIYREVLTLKFWGGLTFAEIAQTVGIPANTAASRYRYGVEELRKITKEVLT